MLGGRNGARVGTVEAGRSFSRLIGEAGFKGEYLVIERNGTPMAVLMGFDVHERPIAACTRDTPDDKSSGEKDNGR